MPDNTEELDAKPSRSSSWLWLFLFVIFMIGVDVWFFQKAVAPDKADLPGLNLNILSASSFVVKNTFLETATLDRPLNILVLGKSGGDYISPNLTDTIFVVHLDNLTQKAKIVSLPRDLAVKIPDSKNVTKINALYELGLKDSEQKGLELIKEKVEEITGLTVDNFVVFDLATVEKIIDDIGGINVYVKSDIYDTSFPAARGQYETFQLPSGLRFLDGKTALKFVRTRHSPRGDFERIERQQEVLKAIKGKLISLNPIWDFSKLWSIFSSIQDNVRTNLELDDIRKIWVFAKNIDLEKIETLGLNPENNLVVPDKANWGGVMAYILVAKPQPFDYTGIQAAVSSFLSQ